MGLLRVMRIPLQTELYLFLQYYKKERFTPPSWQGNWHLALKLKTTLNHQRIPTFFLPLLESSWQPFYSSKGEYGKITLFSPYTGDGIENYVERREIFLRMCTRDKLISYTAKPKWKSPIFSDLAALYGLLTGQLQVDEKYGKKYEGRYDEGLWGLKEKRFESLKKAEWSQKMRLTCLPTPTFKSGNPFLRGAEKGKLEDGVIRWHGGQPWITTIGRLINHFKENRRIWTITLNRTLCRKTEPPQKIFTTTRNYGPFSFERITRMNIVLLGK